MPDSAEESQKSHPTQIRPHDLAITVEGVDRANSEHDCKTISKKLLSDHSGSRGLHYG
jgi:hypothetical protein